MYTAKLKSVGQAIAICQYQTGFLHTHERFIKKICLNIKLLIYKFIHKFFNGYTTYLPSFNSFRALKHEYQHSQFEFSCSWIKKLFHFFRILPIFMFILIPFTLMLCKSLIFDQIYTKFGTLIHLFMVHSFNDLYCWKLYYQSCVAYFTQVIGNCHTSCCLHMIP